MLHPPTIFLIKDSLINIIEIQQEMIVLLLLIRIKLLLLVKYCSMLIAQFLFLEILNMLPPGRNWHRYTSTQLLIFL